jgi:excisionase family DNA binding protein
MEKSKVELPRLAYSVADTAFMLGVSEKSVRRLIDRNLLQASRALRHIRITKHSLDQFLASTSGVGESATRAASRNTSE